MPPNDSFADMLTRLQAGDGDAAAQVFQRFAGRLIGLARRRLGTRAQGKVDPEDVLQSVCKSFFLRNAEDKFELHSWDDLWALLATLTLRKCGHKLRYLHCQKRDVRMEVGMGPYAPDLSDPSWQVVASEPSPSQVLMLTETVEELMRRLEDYHRPIVELSLQGYSQAEIAEQVHLTERTVRRVLKRVREHLNELVEAPSRSDG